MGTLTMTPPFKADQVGSLLRPANLLEARERRRRGEITAADLRRIEDAAIRDVVAMQERIGMPSITDGEFRRGLWHMDFVCDFANVQQAPGIPIKFHSDEGEIEWAPPGVKITGKLARPHPIFVEDFKFLKSITTATPKITIPSPSVLHFRGGRRAIDSTAYPDMDGFYEDLARVYSEEIRDLVDAGCRYLQMDEVNMAFLCDPNLREFARSLGEDPDQLPHTYARLINDATAARHKDMVVCLHLCRGNARSHWVADGGYEPVAEVLFNEFNVDGYFLEYDSSRAGDFSPLRFVPKGKTVVLGLVTTKKGALERKDDIKRRIDEAARFVPIEQLALSPQCGFASNAEGNALTVDQEQAKLQLIVETSREVWG
ncbi:MAG TPA: 5-methyltetrahydropteroyltriglutamate--homocysteine S-methyltransferase [Vicinamibacterales bacterium]|nr:5-methyltetrahydropteroyltriglutamate--homocysteine S-methyltransferase [Vicinamibacterales bacterium]